MTEPTCRHCGDAQRNHHLGGCPKWFEPGPTYATLQSQVRRLREALRPFVEGQQVYRSDRYDDSGHHGFTARKVSDAEYEKARAALRPAPDRKVNQ